MQIGAGSLENMWRFLYNLRREFPYDPAIALLGIYPKDTDVVKRRAICTPMFRAATAMVAKLWKGPRCPSTDVWIRKMWSIYTMEYYASISKDGYPTFVATWTGLEGIMLSEISQAEAVNYHKFSLSCGASQISWRTRNVGEE